MSEVKRKRQRQTIVCDFCRKRKVKCDKGNPCSTCQKYGNPVCHYSDKSTNVPPSKRKSTQVTNEEKPYDGLKQSLELEVEKLKEKIRLIENSVTTGLGVANNGGVANIDQSVETTNVIPKHSGHIDKLELLNAHNRPNDYDYKHNSTNTLDRDSIIVNGSNGQNDISSNSTEIKSAGSIASGASCSMYSSSPKNSYSMGPRPENSVSNMNLPNPITSNEMPNIYPIPSNSPPIAPAINISDFTYANLLGSNPVVSDSEAINFYSRYTAIYDKPGRRSNFGPLSWFGMMHRDNALKFVWEVINQRKTQLGFKEYFFKATPNANDVEKHFDQKTEESFGFNDIRPYEVSLNKLRVNKATLSNVKDHINEKAASIGISFYNGVLDEKLELLDKIELILPAQSVIWLLIERFFSHCYPLFPIIDEEYFRRDISKIIGPEGFDNNKRIKLNIEKKLDFAVLGILLLILRLGYLTLLTGVENESSLNNNDQSPEAQKIKFLLKNPVHMEIVNAASVCLNQFNVLRRINMAVMQLACLTRCYHLCAPEDGDGVDGGDAQVFTGTLVQMALSLGLNREPDRFPDSCNDEKTNNLGRKIWHLLRILDINNAMVLGVPLTINESMYDTKIPFYRKGNSNLKNEEFELLVLNDVFPKLLRMYDLVAKSIDPILNVRDEVKVSELASRLDSMEKSYLHDYRNVQEILNNVMSNIPPFLRVTSIKLYFAVSHYLISISFHLYSYYLDKNNVEYALYYLTKGFSIAIGELMPNYSDFIENSSLLLRGATDLIIMPDFQLAIHKSYVLLGSILIRIKYKLMTIQSVWDFSVETTRNYFFKLTKIDQFLQKCGKAMNEAVSRLSFRYYYSWRQAKATSFTWKIITDNNFYKKNLHRMKSLDIPFTEPLLDRLIDLLGTALAKLDSKKGNRLPPPNPADFAEEILSPLTEKKPIIPLINNSTTDLNVHNNVNTNYSNNQPHSKTGMTNESIDNMWLQMLAIKGDNQYAPTPGYQNTVDSVPDNINTEQTGLLNLDSLLDFSIFDGFPFESQH